VNTFEGSVLWLLQKTTNQPTNQPTNLHLTDLTKKIGFKAFLW
jgi:hypothetical protein